MRMVQALFAVVLAGGVTLSPVWCCCAMGSGSAAIATAEDAACCQSPRDTSPTPQPAPGQCPHQSACGVVAATDHQPTTFTAAAPPLVALLPAGPVLTPAMPDATFTSLIGESPPLVAVGSLIALHTQLSI